MKKYHVALAFVQYRRLDVEADSADAAEDKAYCIAESELPPLGEKWIAGDLYVSDSREEDVKDINEN